MKTIPREENPHEEEKIDQFLDLELPKELTDEEREGFMKTWL